MPTLAGWVRVVLTGTGPGAEVWQTSFAAIPGTPPGSQAALQTLCDASEPAVNAFFAAIRTSIYNSYAYTGIKMYNYAGAGTTAIYQAATTRTPVLGGQTVAGSPIDTAIVLSLRTSLPGRSGRGRMFIPYHGTIQNSNGLVATTAPSVYANAFKTMLNSLSTGPGLVLVVASRTLSQYNVLNKVIADDKPDVQRRRENRLSPSIVTTLTLP